VVTCGFPNAKWISAEASYNVSTDTEGFGGSTLVKLAQPILCNISFDKRLEDSDSSNKAKQIFNAPD